MARQRTVSIIIVTYNAEKTLQSCLNSIYAQENKAIEIIVIDGNSSDNTVQILENNDIDFWKSEPDKGIYDAMNKGLQFITTPFVLFLGADDRLLPEFSVMIDMLKDTSTIYYANVMYKDKKQSGYRSPYFQAKSGIFHQSIVYPAQLFEKYKYNLKYKIAADYALNMKCYGDSSLRFEYVDLIIAFYNDTGISSEIHDTAFENDKSHLILNNFGLVIWLRYTLRRLKQAIKN